MPVPIWPSATKIYHHDTYAAISPSRPELSLEGKTVIITGGGAGIGVAIAHSFATASVKNLALLGRRESKLAETKAAINAAFPVVNVLTVVADVAVAASVTAAFAAINAAFNCPLDILVANAAYFSGAISIKDSTYEEWFTANFSVNVGGSFLVAKAFLEFATATATVLAVTTGSAHLTPPFPGYGAYTASKAAANMLYATLAVENPQLHIVSVHPGQVETEMATKAKNDAPLPDTPELAGDFAVWLASEEAKFLKNKIVWANWDVTELIACKEKITYTDIFTIKLGGWPFAN